VKKKRETRGLEQNGGLGEPGIVKWALMTGGLHLHRGPDSDSHVGLRTTACREDIFAARMCRATTIHAHYNIHLEM